MTTTPVIITERTNRDFTPSALRSLPSSIRCFLTLLLATCVGILAMICIGPVAVLRASFLLPKVRGIYQQYYMDPNSAIMVEGTIVQRREHRVELFGHLRGVSYHVDVEYELILPLEDTSSHTLKGRRRFRKAFRLLQADIRSLEGAQDSSMSDASRMELLVLKGHPKLALLKSKMNEALRLVSFTQQLKHTFLGLLLTFLVQKQILFFVWPSRSFTAAWWKLGFAMGLVSLMFTAIVMFWCMKIGTKAETMILEGATVLKDDEEAVEEQTGYYGTDADAVNVSEGLETPLLLDAIRVY